MTPRQLLTVTFPRLSLDARAFRALVRRRWRFIVADDAVDALAQAQRLGPVAKLESYPLLTP